MSFGFSSGDIVLLVQLAWTTVQNSRKACGEHAEITREITSLHVNLRRLEREIARPESPINRPGDSCGEELGPHISGCRKVLDVLDRILEKYNTLGDAERSKGKLWKAVRFGNGEMANVRDLRSKLIYYTLNLSLFLNMISVGSVGIIERQMNEAGGELKEIRRALNGITANLMSGVNKEDSVLTDYADDDRAIWKAFRRELVKEGFSSNVLSKHKDIIQAYVKELGNRGVLDDEHSEDSESNLNGIEYIASAQINHQSLNEPTDSLESASDIRRDATSPQSASSNTSSGEQGSLVVEMSADSQKEEEKDQGEETERGKETQKTTNSDKQEKNAKNSSNTETSESAKPRMSSVSKPAPTQVKAPRFYFPGTQVSQKGARKGKQKDTTDEIVVAPRVNGGSDTILDVPSLIRYVISMHTARYSNIPVFQSPPEHLIPPHLTAPPPG